MKCLFYSLLLFVCFRLESADKAFLIVIPSYNNAEYYEKNLASALCQKYENYRIIYIDDASTDQTGELVQNYLRDKDVNHRVTFWQNEKNKGALANIYRAASLADPQEIVVTLDGDDWFFDGHVLKKLNAVYADDTVWLTYGQFIFTCGSSGFAEQIPDWVIESSAYRETSWRSTHLRSFYAGLFQKIHVEDLIYQGDLFPQYHGEFFPMAWDYAMMFPMLEMAGHHARFVSQYLYVYNNLNPIGDTRKNLELQTECASIICIMPKYQLIETPFQQ